MPPWYYCTETQAILRVSQGKRPSRRRYGLIEVSDALWEFLEKRCWVQLPSERADMAAIVQHLKSPVA